MGQILSSWKQIGANRARAADQVGTVQLPLVGQKLEESWIHVFTELDLREECDGSLTIIDIRFRAADETDNKVPDLPEIRVSDYDEEGAEAASAETVHPKTTGSEGGPPIILSHPRCQRVPLLGVASYSIKCTGDNLCYQWQHHCNSKLMSVKGEQASSAIQQCFPQLTQDINRPDRLGEMFLAWKVITNDEFEEVTAQPTRAIKCETLIHIFIRRVRSQPHLFHSFCNHLEQEGVTIVASIQEIFRASFKDDEGWEDVQDGDGRRVEGATTSELTIMRVLQSDDGCYRCIVRNSDGQIIISEMAPLTSYSILKVIEENVALSVELSQHVSDKVMQLERTLEAQKLTCQSPDDLSVQSGDTELHDACRRATPEEVETMIRFRQPPPNLNAVNKAGQTPLHVACDRGDDRIVKCLLSYDTLPLDVEDIDGNTPLHVACVKSNYDAVRALLKTKKCKLGKLNKDFNAPLHIAVQEQNLDIVKKLLKYNPKVVNQPNRDLNTPLHLACSGNSVAIVRYLKKEGADKRIQNKDSMTPLEIAERSGRHCIVKALGDGLRERLHM